MSRLRIAIVLGLVIVAAILVYVLVRDDSSADTVMVQRGSIDVSIDTVGTIQLRDPQPVRTKVAGTVAALGAGVGDEVEAGDILVLLDQEELEAIVSDARLALEAAEFSLQFAELSLEENEDALDLQQAVLVAQRGVELARDALQEAETTAANAAIIANRAGTVLETYVSSGDRVAENQQVMLIYSPVELVVIANVNELDLPNVRPGAAVVFRLDSYPATQVEGVVSDTSPQAIQRGGATLFPATVKFDPPKDLDIRPGMNADVSIVTDLREGVLIVPERALRTVGQRAFALVERNGQFEEVEVILGYRSGGVAEVVDGLEEGEQIRLR